MTDFDVDDAAADVKFLTDYPPDSRIAKCGRTFAQALDMIREAVPIMEQARENIDLIGHEYNIDDDDWNETRSEMAVIDGWLASVRLDRKGR